MATDSQDHFQTQKSPHDALAAAALAAASHGPQGHNDGPHGPLGNIARDSAKRPYSVNFGVLGDILSPVSEASISPAQRKNDDRFRILASAGRYLKRADVRGSRNTEKVHRTRTCRSHAGFEQTPALYVSEKPGRASLRGVVTCGNVWACPVCSVQIAAKRADEIRRAEEILRPDYMPMMLSLTAAHGSHVALTDGDGQLVTDGDGQLVTTDNLRVFRAAMSDAWKRMTKHGSWANMLRSLGTRFKTDDGKNVNLQVTVRDVTHGYHETGRDILPSPNGAHFHYHSVIWVKMPDNLRAALAVGDRAAAHMQTVFAGRMIAYLQDKIRPLWLRSLRAAGLTARPDVACVVTGGRREFADYVAKVEKTGDIDAPLPTRRADNGLHSGPQDSPQDSPQDTRLKDFAAELTGIVNKNSDGPARDEYSGLTIWQVLRVAHDYRGHAYEKDWADVYTNHVKELSDTTWIRWGDGFKDFIALADVSDDELANENEAGEMILLTEIGEHMQALRATRYLGSIAALHSLAAVTRDADTVLLWLRSLTDMHEAWLKKGSKSESLAGAYRKIARLKADLGFINRFVSDDAIRERQKYETRSLIAREQLRIDSLQIHDLYSYKE